MITPKDIAALPVVSGARILAASEAAGRRAVREIAVMDVEPLTGDYDVFFPGDAVFTSLGFSGGEGAIIDEALVSLISRDVACIFIKDSLPYEPSERVVAASRRRSVPLIRYESGLLEQIITDARATLAEDARADRLEEELRRLMALRDTGDVRHGFVEVTGLSGALVQAAAFFADEGDPLVLSALKTQLTQGFARMAPCVVARFGKGLLALVAADDLVPLTVKDVEGLTAGFGGRCAAGLSEVLGADEADSVIGEALGCCEIAQSAGRPVMAWGALGPEAFRIARRNNLLLGRACAAGLGRLAACDEEAGSNLVESLQVYVTCGGDVNATAARLCQHPNSVRNRVSRARAVLSMEDATDKQLFAYLAMLYL